MNIFESSCVKFKIIQIEEEVIVYVPNTFTPDGDEYNNEFFPVISAGISEDGYALLIFNRWGELIFESHDLSIGWDGTYNGEIVQDGTYTWKLIVKNKITDDKDQYQQTKRRDLLVRTSP